MDTQLLKLCYLALKSRLIWRRIRTVDRDDRSRLEQFGSLSFARRSVCCMECMRTCLELNILRCLTSLDHECTNSIHISSLPFSSYICATEFKRTVASVYLLAFMHQLDLKLRINISQFIFISLTQNQEDN